MGGAHAQTRKARAERLVRPLAPSDRPPCSGRQAERKVFDIDRLMLGAAAQALGRPPTAWCQGFGGKRPVPGAHTVVLDRMPAT